MSRSPQRVRPGDVVVSALAAETGRNMRPSPRRSPHRPRKHLGQHFLQNPRVARRVVELAEVSSSDAVLEVGPGRGALSELLADRAGALYLVEIDRELAEDLSRRFAGRPTVRVVSADILAIDLESGLADGPMKVVANLPYNIATEVLFRFLSARAKFPDLTLMLQQEVARRLRARPGTAEYGVPTLLVQLYAGVVAGFTVGPGSFYPRPQVMSEVVRLQVSQEPRLALASAEAEGIFPDLVRAAFGQRRKMLRGALRGMPARYGLAVGGWDDIFAEAGVSPTLRAEQVPLDGFVSLANALARRVR